MTEPLVSVKMITYNHAPFIVQAIESVLHQITNYPFELVIGEDCSTDGTREIVFEYQKKHPDIIRIITSDANVGMKNNSMRTMKACKGKYLAFCEGDDYWHNPHKLQKQVDYMESHPDCGLVYSSYDVYLVREKKKIEDYIRYRKWDIPKNPSVRDFVESKSGTLTCTVMVRRNLSEKIIELDPYLHQSGHFLMGDTQLWAEIATVSRLHYLPESLATYNIIDESATRSKDIKRKLRFAISSSELYLYLSQKYDLPSIVRTHHEAEWCDYSLRLAFHSRNKQLADDVRNKKKTFTFEEWFRYFGAKYPTIHRFYLLSASIFNLFRRKHDQRL
jgi:glycosyltransferase involved in cell wall biosynthesis